MLRENIIIPHGVWRGKAVYLDSDQMRMIPRVEDSGAHTISSRLLQRQMSRSLRRDGRYTQMRYFVDPPSGGLDCPLFSRVDR